LFLGQWRNGVLSKGLWVSQTGDSQKEPHHDYRAHEGWFSTSKFSWWRLWRVRAAVCANGHYCATLRHVLTVVLGVWFEWLVSAGPKAFHHNGHCLLFYSLLVVFQNWPLCVTFPIDIWVLNLNFFLTRDIGCFHSILWRYLSGV
jgi:hypothetical protein